MEGFVVGFGIRVVLLFFLDLVFLLLLLFVVVVGVGYVVAGWWF